MFLLYAFNPILVTAAVVPAIVLLVYVYRSDRLEREPNILLISLVFLGIVSTLFAIVSEKFGSAILDLFFDEDNTAYRFLLYFIVVGASEEGFKYLILKRRTWNHPSFNCRFDGVVYAVFVSLGFALWENIEYVLMYGFRTAVLRAVTAVPGHACFGVFMGACYGLAKNYDLLSKEWESKLFRKLAFAVPTLIHGLYDFFASSDEPNSAWIFFVFIAVLFFVTVRLVKRLSSHDIYLSRPENEIIDNYTDYREIK